MYVIGKTPEKMRQGKHIRIYVLYECGGGGEGARGTPEPPIHVQRSDEI